MSRTIKQIAAAALILLLFNSLIVQAVTPGEEFESAVNQLNYYLIVFDDSGRKDDVSLEDITTAFAKLGSYSYASGFYQYSSILAYLEKGDYRMASIYKNAQKGSADFNEYILSDEFKAKYPAIRGIVELATYVEARIAENTGEKDEAIGLYLQCSLFFDSNKRMVALQGGTTEEIYNKALQVFHNEEYEQAYELFLQLSEYGGYKDSLAYLELCRELMHTHDWTAATCTAPKTCKGCGETEGEALGHSWQAATCTKPQSCTRCGATQGSALGHDWKEATCTAPKTCKRCGAKTGSAAGHEWLPATKERPEICSRCGATRGKKLPSYAVGDIYAFGRYEQDNNTSNGKEPIEWIVIEVKPDNSLVLMSKYALDAKPYNTKSTEVTWETCTLREWLNEDFCNAAFSVQEQARIVPAMLENEDRSTGLSGGNATQDKVWLLSYNEVWGNYNKENSYSYFTDGASTICIPTKYAMAQAEFSNSNNHYGACWWWLRAASFDYKSNVISINGSPGDTYITNNRIRVRPVVVVLP